MSPGQATHVLVDGACYPRALQRLYRRDDLADIEPLYLLTRFREVAEQGPILIRPHSSHFVSQLLAEGDGEAPRAMSLIESTASTQALGDHLLQFVEIQVEGDAPGASRLLRFADPLVTRHWLASYGEAVPARVMGPIATWQVAHWAPCWQCPRPLQWQTFKVADSSAAPLGQSPVSEFSVAQARMLDSVTRWQFKARVSRYFDQHAQAAWQQIPCEERDDWLEARFDEGLSGGAQTQRLMAIWMELALHWGADFMTARHGLFERWLAGDMSRRQMSRQQQLHALDAWRHAPQGR